MNKQDRRNNSKEWNHPIIELIFDIFEMVVEFITDVQF